MVFICCDPHRVLCCVVGGREAGGDGSSAPSLQESMREGPGGEEAPAPHLSEAHRALRWRNGAL